MAKHAQRVLQSYGPDKLQEKKNILNKNIKKKPKTKQNKRKHERNKISKRHDNLAHEIKILLQMSINTIAKEILSQHT